MGIQLALIIWLFLSAEFPRRDCITYMFLRSCQRRDHVMEPQKPAYSHKSKHIEEKCVVYSDRFRHHIAFLGGH